MKTIRHGYTGALLAASTICLCGHVLPARGEPAGWTVVTTSHAERPLDSGLAPRNVTLKHAEDLRVTQGARHQLIVKFHDALSARANGTEQQVTLAGDAAGLQSLVTRHKLAFKQLLTVPEEALQALEARAAQRSGRAQPDLAGILVAQSPDDGAATTLKVARELQALPIVEYVEIIDISNPPPPPGDYPPTTPDLSAGQTYRNPDPGIDAVYAWSNGVRGVGIRVSDCEYGFRTNHEDLVDEAIVMEPGHTIHPTVVANNWHEHGTAVLGEMTAGDNGYGVTGLAPDADYFFFPEWTVEGGYRRWTAIANAIAGSDAGDIVVLEMQTSGVTQGVYVPAEYNLTTWNIVKAGTDAGVHVVAAAGNGNQDLDSSGYTNYMDRGDSGSLIVGAGSANTSHNKLSFSTYGSRVNVQGWGGSVSSTGYGSSAQYGGDPDQGYTATFSGTSSATPIVASACVLLQSYCRNRYGFVLDPLKMRQLLIDTGIAQGSGGHIGPFPDVRAAMEHLDGDSDGDTMPTWWELKHFTNGTAALPDGDADSDGMRNDHEWIALTDPTNQNSYLMISNVSYTTTHPVLHWDGRTNREYGIDWATNLLDGFTPLTSGIPGQLPDNVFTDLLHTADDNIFYRLDVSIPPP